MSKSSYRKININGEEWRWKVGSSHISIRGPKDGQTYAPFIDEVVHVDDVERAQWKGYLHIEPRDIRAYILKKIRKIDIAHALKEIFYERATAQYVGGTLCVPVGDEMMMLNLNDAMNKEELVWLSLIYVKHKSESNIYYKHAMSTLENDKEHKKELAIALLKASSIEYN